MNNPWSRVFWVLSLLLIGVAGTAAFQAYKPGFEAGPAAASEIIALQSSLRMVYGFSLGAIICAALSLGIAVATRQQAPNNELDIWEIRLPLSPRVLAWTSGCCLIIGTILRGVVTTYQGDPQFGINADDSERLTIISYIAAACWTAGLLTGFPALIAGIITIRRKKRR